MRELVKQEYLRGNISLVTICSKYKISRTHFTKYLKEEGIEIINKQNVDKFNARVFQNIDSEEKAYWLGFLFADGAIDSGNTNHIELGLQLRDRLHLEKYKEFLQSSLNIKTDSYRARFTITNKLTKKDLESHGCTAKKSLTLKYPKLSSSLDKHFIRGYIDGDGSLSIKKLSKSKSLSISVLGTKEFLEELNIKLGVSCKLYKDKRHLNNTYFISIQGKKALELADYIYGNSCVSLDRKYNKYLEVKNG